MKFPIYIVIIVLWIAACFGCLYWQLNPGSALFDSKDNIPWTSEERCFSVKLIEDEEYDDYFYLAYSNNGFLTSKYLNKLVSDIGSDPFSMKAGNDIQGWMEWIAKSKFTYTDMERRNQSIEAYIDSVTADNKRILEVIPDTISNRKMPDI
jgi:hypothetical protein